MKEKKSYGGMFKDYKDYIGSELWKNKREIELSYRKYCELCGSKRRLQLHHLTYERVCNEKSSDFMVLCLKCHKALHNG